MKKKERHIKLKLMRRFIKEKNIKDANIKRICYGALMNLPKKVDKALKRAKNKNQRAYMLRLANYFASLGKAREALNFIERKKNEYKIQ